MIKRIVAWLLLIGFLILIANVFFGWFSRQLSIGIYIFIALFYVFAFKRRKDQG